MNQHDRQQAAQERGERLSLADLSAVEREALLLLRGDEPRLLAFFVTSANSLGLMLNPDAAQANLLRKGLVQEGISGKPFVRLTPEGLRLQAELWQQGGAE